MTVKEVAAAAGVSFSTVAAVFRGEAWVRPATRERVEAAAARLGYRRHGAASVMASRAAKAGQLKTIHLGWLGGLARIARMGAMKEMRRAVEGRGWLFSGENLDPLEDWNAVGRRWEAIGVDAVVLGRTHPLDAAVRFPWERFVVVSTETHRLQEGFDVVRPSLFRSVFGLLEEVRCRGHRRIGIWLREGPAAQSDDQVRLGACLAFQQSVASRSERLPILRTGFSSDARELRLAAWLERVRPDAVVAFRASDRVLLEECGYGIPQRIGFAAFHVPGNLGGMVAGLPDRESMMPEEVLDAVERKLRSRQRGLSGVPHERVYPLRWTEGETLPERRITGAGKPR